ncbi:MAG TPA: molecular chaperone TorD family protein [Telluria sp.]|nr:molecular chaperone TorD family protein [Telluria sp.]
MELAESDAEEQGRADLYALLARLLFAPPDAYLLQQLAAAPVRAGATQPLELAWSALARSCASTHAADAAAEFDALFVSIDAPRVSPYASVYLTGFLNEKPLVALRDDLARLGLARRRGAGEMEDHLGALCDAMRLLIAGGASRRPQPLAVQCAFFEAHLAPWYARCLNDLRSVPEARFYRLVADLAEAFFDVEALAFELEATSWN